jgi:sec-independent protein translocase protein TatB
MLGVGWGEILVAALVALLVLGPGKLPEAARTAGQVYGRFHRFLSEARAALRAELDLAELTKPAPPPPPDEQDRRT